MRWQGTSEQLRLQIVEALCIAAASSKCGPAAQAAVQQLQELMSTALRMPPALVVLQQLKHLLLAPSFPKGTGVHWCTGASASRRIGMGEETSIGATSIACNVKVAGHVQCEIVCFFLKQEVEQCPRLR